MENCERLSPVMTNAILTGIYPKKVAKKNVRKGIPTMGVAMLTNQLGAIGVTLRNKVYQNKFCFFLSTSTFDIKTTQELYSGSQFIQHIWHLSFNEFLS